MRKSRSTSAAGSGGKRRSRRALASNSRRESNTNTNMRGTQEMSAITRYIRKESNTNTTNWTWQSEENKAVTPACRDRMPGSKLQASQGGPCPRTTNLTPVTNILTIEVERGQGAETGQDDHQAGQGDQVQGGGHPGGENREELEGGQDDHQAGQGDQEQGDGHPGGENRE